MHFSSAHPFGVYVPITLSLILYFFKHLSVLPFAIIIGFKNDPDAVIVNPTVKFSLRFSLHSIFTFSDPFSLMAVLGEFAILQHVSS